MSLPYQDYNLQEWVVTRPSKDHKMVEGALNLHTSHQYNIKEITDMTGVSRSVLY
ncbi:hypothetical protein [Peribacillus butanolivorans]|uniref:hypothetical protein n=1 Tax=Peribacillus butanolivorans TaxID=421767 RepID=UPI003817BCBC